MVAQELGKYYGKDAKSMDADSIVPYLLYMVLLGVDEVNTKEKDKYSNDDDQNTGGLYTTEHLLATSFKSRLMMIEYFTVMEMGFGESYYAYLSFKNVEKMIEDA